MTEAGATPEELRDLLAAVGRHCGCPVGPLGWQLQPCPAHNLLAEEVTICRLLFYRRYAVALLHGEWTDASGWAGVRRGNPEVLPGRFSSPHPSLFGAADGESKAEWRSPTES
jgi:hypothetical protein